MQVDGLRRGTSLGVDPRRRYLNAGSVWHGRLWSRRGLRGLLFRNLLFRRGTALLLNALAGGFMLRPRSQDVALFRHASTATGISRNHVFGLAPRQTSCLGIIVLLLEFGISFAALAIDASPDWGIISARAAI
jgi:hypothetical protein